MPSPKVRITLNNLEERSTSWRIKAIKRESGKEGPVSPRNYTSLIDKILPPSLRLINQKSEPKRLIHSNHEILSLSSNDLKEPDDFIPVSQNHIPPLKLSNSDFSLTMTPPPLSPPQLTGSPHSISNSPHEHPSPTKAAIDDHSDIEFSSSLCTLPPLESSDPLSLSFDILKPYKPREGFRKSPNLPTDISVYDLTDLDMNINSDRRDFNLSLSTDIMKLPQSPKDLRKKEKYKKKKNKNEDEKRQDISLKWKENEPERGEELNSSSLSSTLIEDKYEDHTKWNRPQLPTTLNSRQQKILDVWKKFSEMYNRTIEPLHGTLK
jgi:hypothetical protein